jgi:PleD family two-component response regulator
LATRADLVEAFEAHRPRIAEGAAVVAALWRLEDAAQIEEAMGESTVARLVGTVAEELLDVLAEGEMLGRWERGDLVALLPGGTGAEAQQRVAEGLDRLAGASALAEFRSTGMTLSFSAGTSLAEVDQDLREVVSAAEEDLLKARQSEAGGGAPERTWPPRVLLVEDDRVTATLIHHRLVREGFEVMDFQNGEDAFTWAADSDFDLAVLDVKVPGMDGFELLERLRAMPRLDDVPIVMLTGLGSEADVIRGLELGANDYMLKPFSPTELLARVRRLLYAAGTSEGGAP